MKLFEVTMSDDTMIRNTIGRTMSAEGLVIMLGRLFDLNFSLEVVTPYLRSFNEALQGIDRSSETAVQDAKSLWNRFASELTHPKKRQIPLDTKD